MNPHTCKSKLTQTEQNSTLANMASTIALYVVGILMAYLAYEMAMTPPQHPNHKLWWRCGLATCAIAGLTLTIYQCRDNQIKETQNSATLSTLTNQVLGLTKQQAENEKSFQTKSDNLVAKLFEVHQIQQGIVIAMATNSGVAISPALRQLIIESDFKVQGITTDSTDLNVWLAGLRGQLRDKRALLKMERDKEIAKQWLELQPRYMNGLQYFDYTVKYFTNLLEKMSKATGDKIVSTYHGFPPALDLEGPDHIRICEVSFQTNTACHFEIIMSTRAIQLGINGNNGDSFDINDSGNGSLTITGTQTTRFQVFSNDWKTIIESQLNSIVADIDDKSSSPQK